MNKWSARSLKCLNSADPRWKEVMDVVLETIDCTVLEGHRDKQTQNYLFEKGSSKLQWPHSQHNKSPSNAIDALPYPIDWNDLERLRAFGFFVKGVAAVFGYKVRLGVDWDGDFTNKDQTFHDFPHMEFIN